jgi:hypothetical protein
MGMERAETLDLSGSGLRLTGMALKPGSAAMLDLHLPCERLVVKALVEVVWARQNTAGCRFAAIQEEGASRVRRYLTQKN